MKLRAATLCVYAFTSILASAGIARADINGFNNLVGWTYNQRDGSTPASVGPNSIQITNGSGGEVRDIWYNTAQPITQFTATFTYRAANIGAVATRSGLAFILQADPRGTAALGNGFNASGFGFDGISPSAAVTIEPETGNGETYTGFYRNGIVSGGSIPTAPLNAFDGRDIDVTVMYTGSLLSVAMHDSVNTFPTQTYVVSPSFAAAFGSSNALIGFGASTGAQHGCDQFISNFTYSVPEPATAALCLLGMLYRRRRA